jgi:hypothetical protein
MICFASVRQRIVTVIALDSGCAHLLPYLCPSSLLARSAAFVVALDKGAFPASPAGIIYISSLKF